jgi:lipoyl(octanoyl) transferase
MEQAPAHASRSRRTVQVRWLGRVPYAEALALQERLVVERRQGLIADTLVLLEHPHVITLGTASRPEHVLVDERERASRCIQLFETGRGGDVTYHGPGQLVGYPILDLNPDRRDLHRYLRDLEEVLIRAVATWGVKAHRVEGLTGVWTAGGKVAAIGVRVSSGWITSHGFALNVHTDLSYFRTIVPCGISDREITSVTQETGTEVSLDDAGSVVASAFADVFDANLL